MEYKNLNLKTVLSILASVMTIVVALVGISYYNSFSNQGNISNSFNSIDNNYYGSQTLSSDFDIAGSYRISTGNSKVLANGQFVIGLVSVGSEGQVLVNFNLDKNFKNIYVGESINFDLNSKSYTLIVDEVDSTLKFIEFKIY